MKKLGLLFTTLVMIVLFAFSASAESYGDYEYTVLENGTVEITGYTGVEGEVVVPSEIDGMAVTGVGKEAFFERGEYRITSIFLPDGIISIGDSAFESCHKLKTVNIPKTVTQIGEMAFAETHSLVFIDVDEENEYYSCDENGALYDKDKTYLIQFPQKARVEKYVMPATVKKIGMMAFQYNCMLLELVIPEGVESVEALALYLPFNLRKITLPGTISDFSVYMEQAMALTTVEIAGDAKSINTVYLTDCPALKEIRFNGLETKIENIDITTGMFVSDANLEAWHNFLYDIFWVQDLNIDTAFESEAFMTGMGTYLEYPDEATSVAKIHCHIGSTAEAYAIENTIGYELIHFMGEWVYNWDNYVRMRKCNLCDYTETEALENTESGDVEIIEPSDPDTDFVVEEVEKNSDSYLLIEETVKDNLGAEWNVLKAFDITLKNKEGVHVQPDGTVKVKLPLDWEKDGNYKVYRVNDDGTLTDMNAYRQGSHMVFDTDHFSVYIIVEEKTQELPDSSDEPTTPDKDEKSPLSFLEEMIEWFKNLIDQITSFFRSIGDRT